MEFQEDNQAFSHKRAGMKQIDGLLCRKRDRHPLIIDIFSRSRPIREPGQWEKAHIQAIGWKIGRSTQFPVLLAHATQNTHTRGFRQNLPRSRNGFRRLQNQATLYM
jgi:hypothetical protein